MKESKSKESNKGWGPRVTRPKPEHGAEKIPLAQPLKGKRFAAEQKEHALRLVVSGMRRERVAKVIGTTTESIRRWVKEAERSGTMPRPPLAKPNAETEGRAHEEQVKGAVACEHSSPYAPRDPGQGLSDPEVAAVLEYKKRHPSMGPAQIRAQLKRFMGWRISIKAIARVLKAHGYELVHRGSRPKGQEPKRFEAPRPNALWQADYAEVRVEAEKMHLLLVVDDFSRFVVGHALTDGPSSDGAIAVLTQAIARHGKPEAIRTDRGGGFLAGEFTDFLERELIDHIVGRSYRPQGGGKVEALIATVRRELWDIEHFSDRDQASKRLAQFLEHVNHSRAHMGIDGVTPADRYFGRADIVLAAIDAISRHRQGELARQLPPGDPFEEVASANSGAPLEVLRLVLIDRHAELRFCGARIRLGPVE